MNILEAYETFLLDIISKDPLLDNSISKKAQLKKFIDRFQFLIKKHKEFKAQKAEIEENKERVIKAKQDICQGIQHNILKLNSEIRKTSSNIENLRKENLLLENKLEYAIQNANSRIIRKSVGRDQDYDGHSRTVLSVPQLVL